MWAAARLLSSAAIKLAGGDPLDLTVSATIFLVSACIALGLADVQRRHERALLANMGVRPLAVAAFFALPAVVGELVIVAMAHVIR